MIFWMTDLTCIASIAPISIWTSGLVLLMASLTINIQFSLLSNRSADLSHFLISSMSSLGFSAVMMLPRWSTIHKWLDFIIHRDLYTFLMWSFYLFIFWPTLHLSISHRLTTEEQTCFIWWYQEYVLNMMSTKNIDMIIMINILR